MAENPEKAKKSIDSPKGNLDFFQAPDKPLLAEYKNLPEFKENITTFNGVEAFSKLSQEFADKYLTEEILTSGTLEILYPASGSHIAPLEIALQLFQQTPDIHNVNYTYTEITWEHAEKLKSTLHTLTNQGLFTDFKHHPSPAAINPPGKEEIFTLTQPSPNGPKTITLTFAYKMSGMEYYLDEHFAKSDIFISHDPGNGNMSMLLREHMNRFMASVRSQTAKPHAIFIEGSHAMANFIEAFPGLKSLIATPEGYGCRRDHDTTTEDNDHLGSPDFTQALIFRPDPRIFELFDSYDDLNLFEEVMSSSSSNNYTFNILTSDFSPSFNLPPLLKVLKKAKGKFPDLEKTLQSTARAYLSRSLVPEEFESFIKLYGQDYQEQLTDITENILNSNSDPQQIPDNLEHAFALLSGEEYELTPDTPAHALIREINETMWVYHFMKTQNNPQLMQKFTAHFKQKFAALLSPDQDQIIQISTMLGLGFTEYTNDIRINDLRNPKHHGADLNLYYSTVDSEGLRSSSTVSEDNDLKSYPAIGMLKFISGYIYLCKELKITEAKPFLQSLNQSLEDYDDQTVAPMPELSSMDQATRQNFRMFKDVIKDDIHSYLTTI